MIARIVHVSGPPRAGKTALIRRLAGRFPTLPLARLRAVRDGSGLDLHEPAAERRVHRTFLYDAPRVHEQLRGALAEVGAAEPAIVFLETDADACFRTAYPYDGRVFIMPAPPHLDEVFRSEREADRILRKALQDTGDFAQEFFGLPLSPAIDEGRSGLLRGAARPPLQPHDLTEILESPLGAELAARVKLQTAYHSLLDAHVSILNAGRGGRGEIVDVAARRIERLIGSLPLDAEARPRFFCCDPLDAGDPLSGPCIEALVDVLAAPRTPRP